MLTDEQKLRIAEIEQQQRSELAEIRKQQKKEKRKVYKIAKRVKEKQPEWLKIECKICKELFIPEAQGIMFCSSRCRVKHHQRETFIKGLNGEKHNIPTNETNK